MATSKSLNTARTLPFRPAASIVSFCPIRPSILFSLTHSQATSMAPSSSGPRPGFLTFLEPGEPKSKGQGGNHNSGTMMLAARQSGLPFGPPAGSGLLPRTQAHQWLLVCVSSFSLSLSVCLFGLALQLTPPSSRLPYIYLRRSGTCMALTLHDPGTFFAWVP